MVTNSMKENEIKTEDISHTFAQGSERILGDNFVGVYLHGSAVMGCYNPEKSDLDFMVVVKDTIPDTIKQEFMDMVVALNEKGPAKGIEMSIVKREVCKPFVYPTPFELHFSVMHTKWYQDDPVGYVQNMKGTDKDLAAHFTVIGKRGTCLSGAPIDEVFGEVPKADYVDSLWSDIEDAEEDIAENTMYLVLNLARVLAYLKEEKVLSKEEGGLWGFENLPKEYHILLAEALKEYHSEEYAYDLEIAKEYARFMLAEIKGRM